MPDQHIASAFDRDLEAVQALIVRMGHAPFLIVITRVERIVDAGPGATRQHVGVRRFHAEPRAER